MNTGPIWDLTIYASDHDPAVCFTHSNIPDKVSVTPLLCHGVYFWAPWHKKMAMLIRPVESNGYLYCIENPKGLFFLGNSQLTSYPILREGHVPYILFKKRKVFIPQLRYSLSECRNLVHLAIEHGVLAEVDGKVILWHDDGNPYGHDKEDLADDLQNIDVIGRMVLTGLLHKKCNISIY